MCCLLIRWPVRVYIVGVGDALGGSAALAKISEMVDEIVKFRKISPAVPIPAILDKDLPADEVDNPDGRAGGSRKMDR